MIQYATAATSKPAGRVSGPVRVAHPSEGAARVVGSGESAARGAQQRPGSADNRTDGHAGPEGQEADMGRLRVVADSDVPLHLLADRLRDVGHWVPPDALRQSIDAAIRGTAPALLEVVRAHLRDLGSEDGSAERAMFARVLDLFVDRAPEKLAVIEAAVDAGDAASAEAPARRLARQAAAVGAVPLATLCTVLADGFGAGLPGVPAATRAALRRELALTCRVLAAVAAELAPGRPGPGHPGGATGCEEASPRARERTR